MRFYAFLVEFSFQLVDTPDHANVEELNMREQHHELYVLARLRLMNSRQRCCTGGRVQRITKALRSASQSPSECKCMNFMRGPSAFAKM
uniref:Secreted protein n=1 Tax=Globodera rostochiensis TaxID=31243 RepID=A0A914HLT2_GLORO